MVGGLGLVYPYFFIDHFFWTWFTRSDTQNPRRVMIHLVFYYPLSIGWSTWVSPNYSLPSCKWKPLGDVQS